MGSLTLAAKEVPLDNALQLCMCQYVHVCVYLFVCVCVAPAPPLPCALCELVQVVRAAWTSNANSNWPSWRHGVTRMESEVVGLRITTFLCVQDFAVKCEAQYDSLWVCVVGVHVARHGICVDSGSLVFRPRERPLSYKCCRLMLTRSGIHYISRCTSV